MYKPLKNLLAAIRNAFRPQLFPWDDYYAQMAEADWMHGSADVEATKSFFIRNAPFGGSFALLGGITDALRTIADLRFDDPAFQEGMRDMGFSPDFIEFLAKRKRLRIKVFAPPEGSVFFPNEPIVTIQGPLVDVRLAEGILLEALNFSSLSLTKWYRLVRVVRPGMVFDFSRRRAQNAMKAALNAMLAGASRTSNAELRRFFDVWVAGTMGHEWIQRFGDPKEAFRAWLLHKPNKPIGLVDTKQCLAYDFPAWLDAVYEFRFAIINANPAIWGWRNDSGDLAYLTIEQYMRFHKHPLAVVPWFAEHMRIVLTNDLDEHSAQSIIQQIRAEAGAAGLDAEDILKRIIWAAGTKPGSCEDQSTLGGVAKLMHVADGGDCIKLAFDADGKPGIKTSIPGFNHSALIRDQNGEIKCLLIYPAAHGDIGVRIDEDGQFFDDDGRDVHPVTQIVACHPDTEASRMTIAPYTAEPRQALVYDSVYRDGFTRYFVDQTIEEVVDRVEREVDSLHWTMTRLSKPHMMKVSLTPELFDLRQRMIRAGALRSDQL